VRLQVKGKNVEVSDSLKDYAAQKLGKLDKHLNDAARLELELQVEKNPSISENQVAEAPPQRSQVATRAVVTVDDRRYVLDGERSTIGRSRDADCVLRDPNVSRHHAELRRSPRGEWTIADLGSTNGVKVNGRRVGSTRLKAGDQVTLGTTTFRFDIEQ